MRRKSTILLLMGGILLGSCGDGPKGGEKKAKPARIEPRPAPTEAAVEQGGPWFEDHAKRLGIQLLNRTGVEGKKQFIMSAVGPGPAIFDADGDGRLDVYIPNGNKLVPPFYDKLYDGPDRPRNALFIQQADGTFKDEATARGVDCDRWGFGATAADLDNDGDVDLLVANLFSNRLYLNDGKGHFTDVAKRAGVAGRKEEWTTCFSVGDVNRDGWPDLYVTNYADMFEWMRTSPNVRRDSEGRITDAATCPWQKLEVYCGPMGLPAQQDYLLLGKGLKDGVPQFEDVTKKSGITRPGKSGARQGPSYGFQVLIADFNHDRWPDIFVANDSSPSFYFESNKDGTFRECAEQRGVAFSGMGDELAGMGADFGDINRDGNFDMIKTNFALQTFNVYIADYFKGRIDWAEWSTRIGVERDVWPSLGWGALLFDFDHDGDLDFFFANGHVYPEVDTVPALGMSFKQVNQLFENRLQQKGRLAVKHVTTTAGPGFQVVESSRGASLGDLDNDGDEDIVVVNMNARPTVLMNMRGNKAGRWIQLRLHGLPAKGVTRDALHALVQVDSAASTQYFQVARGRGFLGSSDPRIHVGLGRKPGKVKIKITWPNGDEQTIETDKFDREIEIQQK